MKRPQFQQADWIKQVKIRLSEQLQRPKMLTLVQVFKKKPVRWRRQAGTVMRTKTATRRTRTKTGKNAKTKTIMTTKIKKKKMTIAKTKTAMEETKTRIKTKIRIKTVKKAKIVSQNQPQHRQ